MDTPFDKKGSSTLAATAWMQNNFSSIHDDRQKSYDALTSSDADWTLVRVPMIEFISGTGKVKVSLEDCLGDKITAGDIAKFILEQLSDNQFFKKAPFIFS